MFGEQQMTKPNKKQLDQIKGSLEDNAGDMTRSDLWEYIRDEWHTDNYEADDKEEMERAYVKGMMQELSELSLEELVEERWIFGDWYFFCDDCQTEWEEFQDLSACPNCNVERNGTNLNDDYTEEVG